MKSLTKTFVVEQKNSAKEVGSGSLDVLATPIMIAWMENTAATLASEEMGEGETSVGISLNVQHTKASAIGETIRCEAKLVSIDGRKLSFEIECKDSKGSIIGNAQHDRFIVNAERFMQKLK